MANRFETLLQALGHADFYPNGGVALQPGCVQEELNKNNFVGIVGESKSFPCRYQPLTASFVISWLQSRARLAVFRRVHSSAGSLPDR